MKSRKQRLEEIADLCGEIGADDGQQPKERARSENTRAFERKDRQLCRQVERALQLAIAAHGDARVSGLAISRVEPAPDCSHLLCVVMPCPGAPVLDERVAQALLASVAALLRREVAATIHRRRVPSLTFRYVRAEVAS